MLIRAFAISYIQSPDDFTMPEIDPNDIDAVFTLGNILPETIDLILHMARHVPVLGVLGSLDPEEIPGLDDCHGRVLEVAGVRIGFVNGVPRVAEKLPNHFTEKEIAKALRKMPRADVILSHAPPLSTSMTDDPTHRGFAAFDVYIREQRPRYWIHAHPERSSTVEVNDTGTRVIAVHGTQPIGLSIGETQPGMGAPG